MTVSTLPPSHTIIVPQQRLGPPKANEGSHQATVEQRPPEATWHGWYDDPLLVFTFVLAVATVILGISTIGLWLTTKLIARDGKESGQTQADKMERSISEAARAAIAMEDVAASMGINAAKVVESVAYQEKFGQMQMRAYVSVLLNGLYQDDSHVFEARPELINTGHTPAQGVKWRIAADILPVPLPDDFGFPLPADVPGGGILNPQQTGFMSAFLDREKFPNGRVPDTDLEEIKRATERGFYTWGIVTYRDAFGVERFTKFAHLLSWYPRPAVEGQARPSDEGHGRYLHRHNEAN